MEFIVKYNTEAPVKRPIKSGTYLELKDGNVVNLVEIRGAEQDDDCYVRVYSKGDSEPLHHPYFDDKEFAYIL